MTLEKREKIIKNEFNIINNWEDKYKYLIKLGNILKKKTDEFRSEDKLIHGCQSQVWVEAKLKNKRVFFDADSDALIPKGIAALMIRMYSGLHPIEIVYSNYNFIYEIGFNNFLSPIRANGIVLLLKKIKLYSVILNTKITV
ncbi:SufE family protein [Blattabacterium cuenoti]|uniref:SufE family protein n=1 Tax=Blattabacterium cuenoti TaxID=1653831 RepID=UPI00163C7775|nr:SufE family protein [Blattabacterium cuenoti]